MKHGIHHNTYFILHILAFDPTDEQRVGLWEPPFLIRLFRLARTDVPRDEQKERMTVRQNVVRNSILYTKDRKHAVPLWHGSPNIDLATIPMFDRPYRASHYLGFPSADAASVDESSFASSSTLGMDLVNCKAGTSPICLRNCATIHECQSRSFVIIWYLLTHHAIVCVQKTFIRLSLLQQMHLGFAE